MDLTNEDLLALEERAKKATPGPWVNEYKDYIDAGVGYEVCRVIANHLQNEEQQAHNRQYIAAANPAVVLALINKVRDLEQKNLKLLAAAQQAADEIRRCDYTPARSTLLGAIGKSQLMKRATGSDHT